MLGCKRVWCSLNIAFFCIIFLRCGDRRFSQCYVLDVTCCTKASPQQLCSPASVNMHLAISTKNLFFLSVILFYSGIYEYIALCLC
jgi:hypothetical protein